MTITGVISAILIGIAVAHRFYRHGLRRPSEDPGLQRLGPVGRLFGHAYYYDELIGRVVDAGATVVGEVRSLTRPHGVPWVLCGASFFFDFQKRPGRGDSSLISSTVTLGYAWDCCAVTTQFSSFNVGLRKENRLVFSFRLNGIGSFGTEQFGQRSR